MFKDSFMPKRASKTQDLNQIAADILIDAVGNPPPLTPAGKKNPAAMELVPTVGVQLDPEKWSHRVRRNEQKQPRNLRLLRLTGSSQENQGDALEY